MSWLEELEYVYRFECEDGHESFVKSTTRPSDFIACDHCDKPAQCMGFLPMQLGGHMRVQKEKNGRIYYETTSPDGSITRISKTKLDYLEKGSTESKITREYKTHVQDKQIEDFRRFRYNEALKQESKATVTGVSTKESVQ